ncbi:hypothetical protein [Flavobacterium sp. H122]|uniref:hypothetical protein n=1 Tax=Flavobacterium sp. H122 TaxID=2529860 RepID=UPI0010A9EF4C|nr:hypothetical protein [Flavobacterium sp. H122]
MRITLLFIAFILFSSCGSDEKKIKPIKEITFKLNSPPTQTQIFTDKKNEDYYVFGDYHNKHEISIFSKNKLHRQIPLKKIIDKGEQIDGMILKSTDTLLILGRYTGNLYIINQKGDILKTIDINKTTNSSPDKYEYYTSINNTIENGELILSSSWRSNSKESTPEDPLKNLQYFYEKKNQSYSFLQLREIFKNEKTQFQIKGFESNFEKNKHTFHFDLPYYLRSKNELIAYSIHTDTVYRYKLPEFALTGKTKIVSDFTSIGEKGINLKKTKNLNIQESVNKIAQYGGVIGGIYHSRTKDIFYVIVPHKINQEKEPEKKKFNRDFSILIYDRFWKKINEIKIDRGQYNFYDVLVTKEGLLISKNTRENKNYNPKTARYALFKI